MCCSGFGAWCRTASLMAMLILCSTACSAKYCADSAADMGSDASLLSLAPAIPRRLTAKNKQPCAPIDWAVCKRAHPLSDLLSPHGSKVYTVASGCSSQTLSSPSRVRLDVYSADAVRKRRSVLPPNGG